MPCTLAWFAKATAASEIAVYDALGHFLEWFG